MLSPGDLLDHRYEILREIGRGGYSLVYAARDLELDADVAIKLLVPPPATARIARERMRREVQVVRQLSHANIAAIFDFVDDGPWGAIAMELVDGPDLDARVRDGGPLGARDVATIGWEIAAALSAAHRRGILHRDVKPQNILLARDGTAKLTDFGSARLDGESTLTRTDALVGTLAYAAPEVLAGRRADARADIFALGMTLFYALTGRLPEHPSPHLPPPPAADGHRPRAVRADVPEWLDDAVARATAADPGARFPTAAELSDALAQRAAAITQVGRPRVDLCVLCGAPEPFGLSVCPRCGGAAANASDTLVFVQPPTDAGRRADALRALSALVGARAGDVDTLAVARGERALLRVPGATAERVVEQLAARGLPARAVPAMRAVVAVPMPFLAAVAAVVGVGSAAGALALPSLLWMSPVVAGLLLVAAERSVRAPLLVPAAAPRRLPAEAERRVLASLAQLPPGSARALLADIVRLAQSLYQTLVTDGDLSGVTPSLTELLTAACATALDLNRLDESLAALEERSERQDRRSAPSSAPSAPSASSAISTQWLDALARCERARDTRVQQLLDALAVLGRLYSQTLDAPGSAASRLAEVTRELEDEARAQGAAARELEELLGASAGA